MSYVSRDIPTPAFAPQTTQPAPLGALWPVVWSLTLAMAVILLVSLDRDFFAAALASMGP